MKQASSCIPIKIPYGRQWLDRKDIQAVVKTLKSSHLTQGPQVANFEEALCKVTNARYAVAVSSGTAALHLAALCLDLKAGDEVITTPMSFLATSNAILYANAKPVFADIYPETQCISPETISKKITPRTKAIFFTDFAGHPADLKKIHILAKKHGLKTVEDAAHALGGQFQNSKVGSCRYSDMTIFSFHPVKHITTGEGGAVTTRDSALFQRLQKLRSHGVTRQREKWVRKEEGSWYYEMQDLGWNYRMTDMQAALGISQLKKLDFFVSRRREIAARYHQAFRPYAFLATPQEWKGLRHAYHLYILRLHHPNLVQHKKAIVEDFRASGIGVQIHYIPINMQPYYQKLGYNASETPQALKYYQSALSLPIYPAMKNKDVDFVIKKTISILTTQLN